MNLSAIIITKNEEKNIKRCISSLMFADEVIVVDDFSTDATAHIASEGGAKVIQNAWEGYGAQKNIGAKHATHDWLLYIDADEEVSPALAAAIRTELASPKFDVYWVRILDIFLGKPLHHLTGNNPRLFRKSKAQWTDRGVHEQVELQETGEVVTLGDTNSGRLPELLVHHGHTSIASYLKKMHRYTSLDAKQMHRTNMHRSGRNVQPSLFLPFRLAFRQLVKLLIWRKGILDGYSGIVWSFLSAYYEWEMGWKYLELMKHVDV